jgi:hypothetical protein
LLFDDEECIIRLLSTLDDKISLQQYYYHTLKSNTNTKSKSKSGQETETETQAQKLNHKQAFHNSYTNTNRKRKIHVYVSSKHPQNKFNICDLVSDMTDNQTQTGFCSHNFPFSWFIIDFEASNIAIQPRKYTLKHNNNNEYNQLRSWNFESRINRNDFKWHILKEHRNDESLTEGEESTTQSWILNQNQNNENENDMYYYQQFRIIQIDKNAHGSYILSCGGIEIGGQIKLFCADNKNNKRHTHININNNNNNQHQQIAHP